MTQDEIIEMAQECGLVGMRPHLDGIYIESLLAFAKLVAEKALAEHAMQEVQRIGQEIEQERTWVGLTKQQQLDIFAKSVAKKRSEHEHYMAIEQALTFIALGFLGIALAIGGVCLMVWMALNED